MVVWGKVEVLAASDVWVRDFRCWGEKRPFRKELAGDDIRQKAPFAPDERRDLALELPRRGAHLRTYARETFVVGVTTVASLPAAAEYFRASPSDTPQASTLLTLSGELAERLSLTKGRVLSLSRASASAHQRLLTATSALQVHEDVIALVEALATNARDLTPKAVNRPASPTWKRLATQLQYVLATRYAQRLTLEAIARACGVSPFHAARVFRAVTGHTIHQQLVRERVHHALHELSGGAGALTGLSLRAGFSSHSHFASTFRRLMGVTPSAFAANPRALRAWPASFVRAGF